MRESCMLRLSVEARWVLWARSMGMVAASARSAAAGAYYLRVCWRAGRGCLHYVCLCASQERGWQQVRISSSGPVCSKTRVGQNCIYTLYMTVYLVVSLPKIPYIHRIYRVLANPKYDYNHDMVVERGDCVWVW